MYLMYGKYLIFYEFSENTYDVKHKCKQCVPGLSSEGGCLWGYTYARLLIDWGIF